MDGLLLRFSAELTNLNFLNHSQFFPVSDIETTPTKDPAIINKSETIEDDQSHFANQAIKTNIARWYAIQVASSCEKKVKATLEQRAITLGVSDRIIEIEIPQTPAVTMI